MRTLTLALACVALSSRPPVRRRPHPRRRRNPLVSRQAKPAAAPSKWVMPRTLDGKPDLQGNWTNATITPLERAQGQALVMTEEQATSLERRTQAAIDAASSRAIPTGRRPRSEAALRPSPTAEPTYLERMWQAGAGVVGGYNSFWIDPGDRVVRIDGAPRSSILIDPPDGRVPALTTEGRARDGRGGRIAKEGGQRVRSSRAAAARRALHHVVWQQRGSADAAELLLQQQLHDRAGQDT